MGFSAAVFGASFASADTVLLVGKTNSAITGTLDFNYNSATTTITIVLENTTSTTNAEFTGLAFNLPAGSSVTSVGGNADGNKNDTPPSSLSASSDPGNISEAWFLLYHTDNIKTPQSVGKFDVGLSGGSGGNFITGGGSGFSIDPGETTTFSIGLVGTGLGSLTTSDFLSAMSVGGDPPANFVVRAQSTGANKEDSDVLTGTIVPTPTALIGSLAMLGLFGAGTCRRPYRANP